MSRTSSARTPSTAMTNRTIGSSRSSSSVGSTDFLSRLSRKLVAGVGHAGGRWSCGNLWAEENVVSEVVEAPDQGGARPCLLIKERLSEFLEGNGLGEHMKHRHQDLVRDGGPLRASVCLQPVVLVFVVAALCPG